jgi:hypothetical protein
MYLLFCIEYCCDAIFTYQYSFLTSHYPAISFGCIGQALDPRHKAASVNTFYLPSFRPPPSAPLCSKASAKERNDLLSPVELRRHKKENIIIRNEVFRVLGVERPDTLERSHRKQKPNHRFKK